jgi:hypothetical protein
MIVLAIWFALSLPLGILAGTFFKRADLMDALPYEVRGYHGRFVTPLEQDILDGTRRHSAIRKGYAEAQRK